MFMNIHRIQGLMACLWLLSSGWGMPVEAWAQESLAVLYVDAEGDPNGDGSLDNPFNNIQQAIDVFDPELHDRIMVFDGTYTGDGNRDLDFHGKALTLKSAHGPDTCIIDCQGSWEDPQWGFTFQNGEDPNSLVDGFTITGGFSELGSAVLCINSAPTIANCRFIDNAFEAITLWESDLHISGTVEVVTGDLGGDSAMIVKESAELVLADCRVTCFITGTGHISIPIDRTLTLAQSARVDMGPLDSDACGTMNCEGVLQVTDDAVLTRTSVNINSAEIDRRALVTNNDITISRPYTTGLVVEGAVTLTDNGIYAQGDNYLNVVDPDTFTGTLGDNQISLTMEQNNLLECQARDLYAIDVDVPDEVLFLDSVPAHDPNTRTLETLTIMPDTTLVLADRFDDQPDLDTDELAEVIYARHVEVGPYAILDLGYKRLYCETLEIHPTARVINRPLLGYSLGLLDFSDEQEYRLRVRSSLGQRIEGENPDPTGMMRLYYDRNQVARAKARFRGSNADQVWIGFNYLFKTDANDLEVVVYLSDTDTLMDYNDSHWGDHYVEVGRLRAPPAGCPGAYGSGRFGRFQARAGRGFLNLRRAIYVELALVSHQQPELLSPLLKTLRGRLLTSGTSGDAAADTDDWSVEVHCDGICMDLDWSDAPDEDDFMIVVSGCGRAAALGSDGVSSTTCLDGPFTGDGFVDSYDVASWDWALDDMSDMGHLCGLPLVEGGTTKMFASASLSATSIPSLLKNNTDDLNDVLILGKNSDKGAGRLHEGLYGFQDNGVFSGQFSLGSLYSTIRILPDQAGGIYVVDISEGVQSWTTSGTLEPVVPAGRFPWMGNTGAAYIGIGIHGKGSRIHGRPVLDAVIKAEDIYIVPVVVEPNVGLAHLAAARLQRVNGQSLPYNLVDVFDLNDIRNPHDANNPNLSGLREIAVDDSNNVFLLNAHSQNESDMLIRITPVGTATYNRLNDPLAQVMVTDPLGLCVSGDKIYLASGQNGSYSPSVRIYGFSINNLSHQRTITVRGMSHITDVSRGHVNGSLVVVGFKMNTIPVYPSAYDDPFYEPYMALIPDGINDVNALPLSNPGTNLALPLSILWAGN